MKPTPIVLCSLLLVLVLAAGCTQSAPSTPVNEGPPAPPAPSPGAPPVSAPVPAPGFEGKVDEMIVEPNGGISEPAEPEEPVAPVSATMPAPGFEGKVDEMIVNPDGDSPEPGSMHMPGMMTPGKMMPQRVIDVEVDNWYFEPNPIRVKFGEHVKLVLHVEKGFHGFALPAFDIEDKTLSQGSVREFEFTADKKGSFGFYCNVFCGSGHSEMKGTLVVE